MADERIIPAANNLLSCLATQLNLNPDPPARFELRAGDEVLHDVDAATSQDLVCCPGLAYVRVGTVFPASNFPAQDSEAAAGCLPTGWAVQLVMGVVRCVPGIGQPSGPSASDWTTAATRDANDIDALLRALCCWADTLKSAQTWLAQEMTVSMQADCIERQMGVLLRVGRCC